ncbi:hypothetical protein P167DRAFT_567524 [Morchella conica CCBAS932]|uniref:Uncharacterized protein n=1 Tax=Morchella conica CCBAS932 TaxID=1392247 RepID=A0A3N4KEP8_9PEZI|nr:hypothetical protein P167DRAFT_567524 [Morchella conica CCBAS932]
MTETALIYTLHDTANGQTRNGYEFPGIRLWLDGTEFEPKLDKTNEDLEAQTQCVQYMAVDSALHPMRAIDGDKKPLRQWLKGVERCQKSGGEDYDLVQKKK